MFFLCSNMLRAKGDRGTVLFKPVLVSVIYIPFLSKYTLFQVKFICSPCLKPVSIANSIQSNKSNLLFSLQQFCICNFSSKLKYLVRLLLLLKLDKSKPIIGLSCIHPIFIASLKMQDNVSKYFLKLVDCNFLFLDRYSA